MASPQEILEALRAIPYPGYTRDIVSFGIVKDIEVAAAGVTVLLAPTTEDDAVVHQIARQVHEIVAAMNLGTVTIRVERPAQARTAPRGPQPIAGVRHVVAVASGKGGVGKSTIATNLAVALAERSPEAAIGLMDADVYGPSIPLMLGIHERPDTREDRRIVPVTAHGLKVISMGLFVDARTPVIWRGPMLTKLLGEFARNVEWGELDCLVLDLPPGTGDVQLTITQQIKLAGGVIVTTPQDVALLDVQRGITMFNQVGAPVIGVIENMSYHVCASCGHRAEIFGHGGGARMAERFHVPFLGEIPLYRAVRACADSGRPIVAADPGHPVSVAIREIARKIADWLTAAGAADGAPSRANLG
jgi:ATP-binding protein involved in chromosome partitioning